MRPLLLVSILCALLAQPALASEVAASEAERHRLEEELGSLARRNAWSGVERTYRDLLEIGLPPSAAAHYLGYQAANARGDVAAALARLESAVAAAGEAADDPTRASAQRDLEALKARYGRVAITVVPPRLNVLVAYQTPFVAQEREAIDQARQQLIATNAYAGLLPVGKYMVDGVVFEIAPQGDPVQVDVTP